MRRKVEPAQRMAFLRRLGDCPAAPHREDAPFHLHDFIVPRDDRLVTERIWVVHALGHGLIDPIRQGERLVGRVEKRERMDFFGGADLQPEKAFEPNAPRTFRNGGGVARRLVIGERDSIHADRHRPFHNLGRCHLEVRARRQAGMDVEVELHFTSASPSRERRQDARR